MRTFGASCIDVSAPSAGGQTLTDVASDAGEHHLSGGDGRDHLDGGQGSVVAHGEHGSHNFATRVTGTVQTTPRTRWSGVLTSTGYVVMAACVGRTC